MPEAWKHDGLNAWKLEGLKAWKLDGMEAKNSLNFMVSPLPSFPSFIASPLPRLPACQLPGFQPNL
jgi:hypothetical protein